MTARIAILSITYLLLSYSSVFAQVNQAKLDSLKLLLAAHPQQDTLRVSLLNRYARLARHTNPDTAMVITREALDMATALKSRPWMAQLLATQSMIFSKKNQYDSCIKYGRMAADMLREAEMPAASLTALNLIAENYSSQGRYSKAIDIFHEVIQQAEAAGSKNNLGSAYGNIGSIYLNFGIYPRAIEYYEKALTVFREAGDSILIAAALSNIGISYERLDEYRKAEDYQQQAIHIFQAKGRVDVLPDVQTALALAYARQGKTGEAMELLSQSMDGAAKLNNTFSIANAAIVRAVTGRLMGERTGLRQYYTAAFDDALQGLKLSESLGEKLLQRMALKELAALSQHLHRYEEGFTYQAAYITINDSIAGENRRQEIALKESEFNHASAQAILKAGHLEELRQQRSIRNMIVIGAAMLLLVAAVVLVFYRRLQRSRVLRLQSEMKAGIADLEMKALRAQMNPHFIFNSLNSIADFIGKNRAREARDYLTKFARLMRMILEHSEQKEVPLANDLEALSIYMELECLRFEQPPTCTITVDPALDPHTIYVPSLLLQPFVENSFKHGVANLGAQGKISINIYKEGDLLHCRIDDNGSGRGTGHKAGDHVSLGTAITQARISQFSPAANGRGSVSVTDLIPGTRVDITLQV